MITVTLVRHGESTDNLKRIWAGWKDAPLSQHGMNVRIHPSDQRILRRSCKADYTLVLSGYAHFISCRTA